MVKIHRSSEMDSLKNRLRTTWMAGDFGVIARSLAMPGVEFVERLGLGKGTKVLDLACGDGAFLSAALRITPDVTGVDVDADAFLLGVGSGGFGDRQQLGRQVEVFWHELGARHLQRG